MIFLFTLCGFHQTYLAFFHMYWMLISGQLFCHLFWGFCICVLCIWNVWAGCHWCLIEGRVIFDKVNSNYYSTAACGCLSFLLFFKTILSISQFGPSLSAYDLPIYSHVNNSLFLFLSVYHHFSLSDKIYGNDEGLHKLIYLLSEGTSVETWLQALCTQLHVVDFFQINNFFLLNILYPSVCIDDNYFRSSPWIPSS